MSEQEIALIVDWLKRIEGKVDGLTVAGQHYITREYCDAQHRREQAQDAPIRRQVTIWQAYGKPVVWFIAVCATAVIGGVIARWGL